MIKRNRKAIPVLKSCMLPLFLISFFIMNPENIHSQVKRELPSPPMGFMGWNYFGSHFNAQTLKEVVDSMVSTGMTAAGYDHIFIDDAWQGGRDNRNKLFADPEKFPDGMKAFVDYVHGKRMKVGIYSDADQYSCLGYNGSLGFEELDAKTFAEWGIDYLKYDACGVGESIEEAKRRYKAMGDALRNSGRRIIFSISGPQPWLWGEEVGAHLWRVAYDVRDRWENSEGDLLLGIMDIVERNVDLGDYAIDGHWNDPDMLVVGLHGKTLNKYFGGEGCTDAEYQSQMSLWAMMASPLIASVDPRNMDDRTKAILMNKEVIAVNQDLKGKQGTKVLDNSTFLILVKELVNGEFAVSVTNKSTKNQRFILKPDDIGLTGEFSVRDLWNGARTYNNSKTIDLSIKPHETILLKFE